MKLKNRDGQIKKKKDKQSTKKCIAKINSKHTHLHNEWVKDNLFSPQMYFKSNLKNVREIEAMDVAQFLRLILLQIMTTIEANK